MSTELIIGPLRYTHVVQKITCQERRAVDVVEVTRSSRNFIVDSGDAEHRAQIRFLFTGLDEINRGVGEGLEPSGLRGLIALFKSCPVIVLKNTYLSSTWKHREDNIQKSKYKKAKQYLEAVDKINKAKEDISSVVTNTVGYSNYILEAINKKFNKDFSVQVPNFIKNSVPSEYSGTPIAEIIKTVNDSEASTAYSDFVAIALDSIELENVPDIPFAIQATLNISRVDVAPFTETGTLEFIGEKSLDDKQYDPQDAYWLKKWIGQVLDGRIIPELRLEDFKSTTFTWYGQNSIGGALENEIEQFSLDISSTPQSEGLILAENCTIRHRFAYNKLMGKLYPTPAHMGTTGRFMSLDIIFNNQKSYDTYEKFCNFKHAADLIAKKVNRLDRVSGWHVRTPISKLLSVNKTILNSLPSEYPWEGVYVPIHVNSETGQEPDMINVRIDLAENNIDFFTENEITLASSGTDYEDLKKYYLSIVNDEDKFRIKIATNIEAAIAEIIGNSDETTYKAYTTFWPIEKSIIYVKNESRFGILNADTLRATIMSKYLDPGQTILTALLNTPLATGEILANRRVDFLDKLVQNGRFAVASAIGISTGSEEVKRVYDAVLNIVKNKLFYQDPIVTSTLPDIEKIATDITLGYLGDRTAGIILNDSITGLLIAQFSKTSVKFTPDFIEALFKVIIQRAPKPKQLPYIYSTDGVYAAFYKLITKFTLERDSTITPAEELEDIKKTTANRDSLSLYPDLLLPTYIELFEDRWEEFALTIADLGIDYYDEVDPAFLAAVTANDYVSPAVWFYIRRAKLRDTGLVSIAKNAIKAVNDNSPEFSLSVPFNTEDIDKLKELIKAKNDGQIGSQLAITNKAIAEIIKKAFLKHKTSNPSGYREDITNLATIYPDILENSTAATRLAKKYLQGNGSIKLYIHHNGNRAVPREVTIPGLGAEVVRIIDENKELLIDNPLRRLDADAEYVTPLQKEVKYKRHMAESTEQCVMSCIDQLSDDQFSPERIFPSMRVYLLDRRGSDLIADDTLFSLASVVSIDITLDKDDAPLAVVKLADPLYTLQGDYFDTGNVVYKDEKPDRVLGSLREVDKDSYIKRYKLSQGRSVQIRMGYSSMARNLPIVFTGRITEIVPGDQLTIVCQGWKAELINRQVSFYCDDSKNWGARDLAIQAMTYASPDGFGDFYPEFDAQFILRNLGKEDITSAVNNSLANGQDIDLTTIGSRGILNGASNWALTSLGFSSTDKDNKGLDTRLKNIWYPDTALYNNPFGLRSRFGVMPSWHNDSWIVPLQPAWDVLKEASRHAWNCIVDVVPYEGEATLFMGHPDQPYFFSRGTALSRKGFNKYNNKSRKNIQEVLDSLIRGFLTSKYFEGEKVIIDSLSPLRFVPGALQQYDLVNIPNLKEWVKLSVNSPPITRDIDGSTNTVRGADALLDISKSTLPVTKLSQVRENVGNNQLLTVLFCQFFGIDREKLKTKWATSERDIEELLARDSELNPEILSTLDGMGLVHGDRLYNLVQGIVSSTKIEDNGEAKRFYLASIKNSSYLDQNAGIAPSTESSNLIKIIILQSRIDPKEVEKKHKNKLSSVPGRFVDPSPAYIAEGRELYALYRNLYNSLRNVKASRVKSSFLTNLGVDVSTNITSLVRNNFLLFKAFIYYFCTYVLENTEAKKEAEGLKEDERRRLPPTMKVFRTFHFADNNHNIIKNLIVASTREMWNTVVIEHPSPGSAESQIGNKKELFDSGRFNSGVNWVYYPSQEVTGVIGLQFHPGLTLANKKVQVFTELNCQSQDLAAKIACTRLAEGIRKMYRGNLVLLGKNMKPHDRIILADAYTRMKGPVEVESVVHHWNVDQGWITNITPNAISDANPGASILHTAALETTFQAVYNTIDFVSDALTVLLIVATVGAATPLAVGQFSIRKGVLGVAKRFLGKNGGIRSGLRQTVKSYGRSLGNLKNAGSDLRNVFKKGHSFDFVKRIVKDYGGPGVAYLKNQLAVGAAEWGTHMFYKSTIIPGFIDSAGDVEQLPVIISPLIFNGIPFTAGLETEDSIWSIAGFGLYYSIKEVQAGASRLLESFFE